jgi:5-methylcytosine-specific restriction endonuclease McrA
MCAICKNEFPESQVEQDHVIPVVDPKTGYTTLDEFADRLLAPLEGWQTLCNPCHSEKSFQETGVRTEQRAKKRRKKKK